MGMLQAVSVGVTVPRIDFRGAVHSVFETALNFTVDGLPDDLLTVFTSDNTDLPQGIRLQPGNEGYITAMRPGKSLECSSGVLRFAGSATGIQMTGARRYSSPVSAINVPRLPESGLAAWRQAFDLLAARQQDKAADVRVAKLFGDDMGGVDRFASAIDTLVRASRDRDRAAAETSVQALVGLGGGLTPAGDDVLVGFLAGLLAGAGEDAGRADWAGALASMMRARERATTDISRSYIVLAARGQFSGSLSRLAEVICTGAGGEEVRRAAGIVFQTGHTSGMDAATGLLAGLSVYNESLSGRD